MDAPFAFPDLKLVTEDVPEEPKLTPVEEAAKLIAEGKQFLKRFNEEKAKFEDEMLAKKENEIQQKKNQEAEVKLSEEEAQLLLKKERHEEREATRKKRDIDAILKDACYSFSEASELLLTTFGAESPKIAESFLLYGSSLLTTVQESGGGSNIFSDPVADTIEKKAQVIDQSFNEHMGGLDEEGDEEGGEGDEGSEYSDEDGQGDSADDYEGSEESAEGQENQEAEMGEGEENPEDGSEDSVEDSNASSELSSISEPVEEGETLELAWDVLERARFALQSSQDADYKFLLSEVHERLADVALESDNFEGAFEEFQKCIAIRTDLGEKRSLAEVYFLAGIAMQNEKKAESLDFLQKAQTILEELLMKSPENKKEELISIIIDVKKRVAEVKEMIENSNKIEPASPSLKTSDGAVRDLGVVGGTRKPRPQQQESNTTTTTSTTSTTENSEGTRTRKKRKALEEDEKEAQSEKKKKTD